jgi:arabinose-5-phosphate isomerase
VIGMGKSGHIGHKLAATLASTGTAAFFVHPAEASHGDLGMINSGDIVICLSNSGETQEISQILPALKHKDIYLISITGNKTSTLAKASDAHIFMSIKQEACPLDLAPTASTTAMLAICDALAVALLEAKNFSAEDFAISHPAGRLGKRLLLKVADLMHKDDELPFCQESASLADALIVMTEKRLGMVAIINEKSEVVGIFTDGDARRTLANIAESGQPLHSLQVADWMSSPCTTSTPETLAFDALHILQEKKIGALAIVNNTGVLAGALNFHDLLNAGL